MRFQFSALMNALLPYLAIHHGANAVFVARFILGAGESFIYPCINTMVTNWFPIDERSTAVALFTTGNQVALFLGNPLAAGLCDSSYGWPSVYYISGSPTFFGRYTSPFHRSNPAMPSLYISRRGDVAKFPPSESV
ncbi:hypothetical protein COOONC_14948 [Cooperia oncophora]